MIKCFFTLVKKQLTAEERFWKIEGQMVTNLAFGILCPANSLPSRIPTRNKLTCSVESLRGSAPEEQVAKGQGWILGWKQTLFKSSQTNLDLQSLSPALHSKASNPTKNQGFILWKKLRRGFSGFKGITHSGAVGWSVKLTTSGLAVIRILKRLLLQQQHPGIEPQTFSLPCPPSYPTFLLTLLGDWTIFWKN